MDGAALTKTVRTVEVPAFSHLWQFFSNHRIWPQETKNGKTPTGRTYLEPDPLHHTPMACFSPAEYDGRDTKDDNVLRTHFGVLDFDKITPDKLAHVLTLFSDVQRIFYSTYSHGRTPGVGSYRLVFPFSEPVDRKDWANCWLGMSSIVNFWNDPICCDLRRIYYFPCTVLGREQYRSSVYLEGTPGRNVVDPKILIQMGSKVTRGKNNPELMSHARPEVTSVGTTDILEMASELRRKKSLHYKEMGAAIKRAMDGGIYAPDGERDKWLFKLSKHIAEFFPHCDPVSVADLFRPSLERTCNAFKSGDPHTDFVKLVDKLQRALIDRHAQLEKLADEKDAKHRSLIREAFQAVGQDRDWPYTPEDVKGFADSAGVSVAEFNRRWILSVGRSFYLFVDGHYLKPIGEQAVPFSAQRDLSPATTAGVKPTDEGGFLKTPKELITEHGTLARYSKIDLMATQTMYNPIRQEIIEATCPIRSIPPERVPLVETWLKFLGGEKVELLLDWVSVVTRLDRPAAILYLCGPKSIGKTTFANGLARIWTTGGYTPMATAFSRFRESLTRCALVVANEELPLELRGRPSTALRDFMDQTERKIERKHIEDSDCVGAVRVILNANNPNLLQTEESLTSDDLDALSQRLLFIRPDPQAGAFLQALASAGIDFRNIVINQDGLAKHALWLKETRSASADNGRYFVQDVVDNELTNGLASTTGRRSAICHWLVSYLQRPALYDGQNTELMLIHSGCLFASAQAIHDAWSLYMPSHRQPTAAQVGESLHTLSSGSARVIPRKSGRSAQYYPIRIDLLIHWATRHGFSSEQEIRQALMRDSRFTDLDVAALALYSQETRARRLASLEPQHLGVYHKKNRMV